MDNQHAYRAAQLLALSVKVLISIGGRQATIDVLHDVIERVRSGSYDEQTHDQEGHS